MKIKINSVNDEIVEIEYIEIGKKNPMTKDDFKQIYPNVETKAGLVFDTELISVEVHSRFESFSINETLRSGQKVESNHSSTLNTHGGGQRHQTGNQLQNKRNADSSESIENEIRFHNPYNFISYIENDLIGELDRNIPEMGRKLSGRLICELETKTPVFIGGEISGTDQQFYKIGKTKTIPASSIKGMVRNVFEAITNSCFSVFDAEKHLGRRTDTNDSFTKSLIPARYEGNDSFLLLEGKSISPQQRNILNGIYNSRFTPAEPKKQYKFNKIPIQYNAKNHKLPDPTSTLKPAWINQYCKLYRKFPPAINKNAVKLNGLKNYDKAWALLKADIHDKVDAKGNVKVLIVWRVVEQFYPGNEEGRKLAESALNNLKNNPDFDLYGIFLGYLYITGQNMENKHDEKFFFCDEANHNNNRIIATPNALENYKKILHDYRNINKIDAKKDAEKKTKDEYGKILWDKAPKRLALSHFMWNEELNEGDLVYVEVDKESKQITKIFPVQLSRVLFEKPIGEFLPELFKPCSKYEKLCPACRVFGWVKQNKENNLDNKDNANEKKITQSSIAGKIFIDNIPLDDAIWEKICKIPELSVPQPSTTFFYLKQKDNGFINKSKGYNSSENQKLRGRKYYVHHKNYVSDAAKFIVNGTTDTGSIRYKELDCYIKNPTKLFFSVGYKDLSEFELGALIWSLNLEDEMYHRLGYGKPLGFGSVKIKVTKAFKQNPDRYSSFDESRYIDDVNFKIYETTFKDEYIKLFKNTDFTQVPIIKELKVLLEGYKDSLKIHYPRCRIESVYETHTSINDESTDKNYEWFIIAQNKRISLDFPIDEKGLPYL